MLECIDSDDHIDATIAQSKARPVSLQLYSRGAFKVGARHHIIGEKSLGQISSADIENCQTITTSSCANHIDNLPDVLIALILVEWILKHVSRTRIR